MHFIDSIAMNFCALNRWFKSACLVFMFSAFLLTAQSALSSDDAELAITAGDSTPAPWLTDQDRKIRYASFVFIAAMETAGVVGVYLSPHFTGKIISTGFINAAHFSLIRGTFPMFQTTAGAYTVGFNIPENSCWNYFVCDGAITRTDHTKSGLEGNIILTVGGSFLAGGLTSVFIAPAFGLNDSEVIANTVVSALGGLMAFTADRRNAVPTVVGGQGGNGVAPAPVSSWNHMLRTRYGLWLGLNGVWSMFIDVILGRPWSLAALRGIAVAVGGYTGATSFGIATYKMPDLSHFGTYPPNRARFVLGLTVATTVTAFGLAGAHGLYDNFLSQGPAELMPDIPTISPVAINSSAPSPWPTTSSMPSSFPSGFPSYEPTIDFF